MAQIENCDLFISLAERDVDSYVSCKMAKKIFNAKKCVATVINPKNVELFQTLGVDVAISSTYLLAETIKAKSSFEDLIKMVDNYNVIVLDAKNKSLKLEFKNEEDK
mgnify:CR=1 FL=1